MSLHGTEWRERGYKFRKEKRDFGELALFTAPAEGQKGEGRHAIDMTENIVLSSLIFLFLAYARPALRMVFLSLGCFL